MNTCDHGHDTTGEIRRLPYGSPSQGGAVLVCYEHYRLETLLAGASIADEYWYALDVVQPEVVLYYILRCDVDLMHFREPQTFYQPVFATQETLWDAERELCILPALAHGEQYVITGGGPIGMHDHFVSISFEGEGGSIIEWSLEPVEVGRLIDILNTLEASTDDAAYVPNYWIASLVQGIAPETVPDSRWWHDVAQHLNEVK